MLDCVEILEYSLFCADFVYILCLIFCVFFLYLVCNGLRMVFVSGFLRILWGCWCFCLCYLFKKLRVNFVHMSFYNMSK